MRLFKKPSPNYNNYETISSKDDYHVRITDNIFNPNTGLYSYKSSRWLLAF